MELLLCCFELPTTDSDCSYLTTTEILTYLGTYTRQPLTAKRMGEALKKGRIHQGQPSAKRRPPAIRLQSPKDPPLSPPSNL